MRTRIELETLSDVQNFCKAVSTVIPDVFLVDNIHRFKVNAKSTIGALLAQAEWSDGIFVECEEDIYSIVEPWVARNSNVTIHD